MGTAFYDSWTPGGRLRTSSPNAKATRAMANPTRLFARNIAALRKLDLTWLTQDTQWLDGDRKYIVEAPQTHLCSQQCKFRNRSHPVHEAAARQSPALHGRLPGSVTLVKTGAHTLIATVRLTGEKQAAATVQLRREPPRPAALSLRRRAPKRGAKSIARVLAYLGRETDINLSLSSLTGFLSQRHYVEQAMRLGAKAEKNFHASTHPMRMEGRRTSVLDAYDMAGAPKSPERERQAKHPQPILRGWAQNPLKDC